MTTSRARTDTRICRTQYPFDNIAHCAIAHSAATIAVQHGKLWPSMVFSFDRPPPAPLINSSTLTMLKSANAAGIFAQRAHGHRRHSCLFFLILALPSLPAEAQ